MYLISYFAAGDRLVNALMLMLRSTLSRSLLCHELVVERDASSVHIYFVRDSRYVDAGSS